MQSQKTPSKWQVLLRWLLLEWAIIAAIMLAIRFSPLWGSLMNDPGFVINRWYFMSMVFVLTAIASLGFHGDRYNDRHHR